MPDEPCGLVFLGDHAYDTLKSLMGHRAWYTFLGSMIAMLAISIAAKGGLYDHRDIRLHIKPPSQTMLCDGVV
jgi:hypothetical protein